VNGGASGWRLREGQSLYRKTSPLPLSSVERGKIDANITGAHQHFRQQGE